MLVDGLRGREGFVFHDGHNRPVHQAAPGLLGLLEGRQIIERWKPRILGWLDGTEHFFNHLCAEFEGEEAFAPIRSEIDEILAVDAPLPVRNQFLFQYLNAATRELERRALSDVSTVDVTTDQPVVSLNGPWLVHYRQDQGVYVDRVLSLPVNWELVPGIDNYAGSMRFTRIARVGDEVRDRRLILLLHGVDYFAELWVNGHYVGGHEGFFSPLELDITPYVRFDQGNILRLTVASPNDPAGPGTHVTSGWDDFSPASSFPNRKTLLKGTLGHHDAKRGGAWSSMTSQDGNTGGVWNDIDLLVPKPVHFVAGGIRVTTLSVAPDAGRAALQVQVSLRNATDRLVDARLRVRVEPANFGGHPSHECDRTLVLRPGANEVTLVERLAPIQLWSPRDHGFPHLYTITATVDVAGEAQDEATVETGFRTLAVSPIGESEGRDGAFVVNGEEVFVRGTNLLPTYWLSEYSPERIQRDFELLAEGGFNAVLVHTLVLPDRFYEEADRRGFLVEQIFPLQWSYEQSNDFATRAQQQIQEMARLLVNHPSVVSYEVHNEPDMRTFADLDNRVLDFDLHATLRGADPSRWATTYSSGNHAYPGQFYPLRDDNSFATLPARFLEHEFNGRRISRHRNLPTEFGIQAMPNVELFKEILAEDRVRRVLERIRTDPKWAATGAEGWQEAEKTLDEAKSVLGKGSWDRALNAFDWRALWDIGALVAQVRTLQDAPQDDPVASRELVSNQLAVLVLEVLHYGGFKGENFWFGLWRPAPSLEDFVRNSQDRQYRLHKEAIEMYLNAGAVGPIVGYFSFMFRDADWQAPTWGVVDASWTPKKAYRAYAESNHPVRVTLPAALYSPVKLPGDRWLPVADSGTFTEHARPWAEAGMIVANDTRRSLPGAQVTLWLEDGGSTPLAPPARLTVDLDAGGAWTGWPPEAQWTVSPDIAAGTYFLKAQVASSGGEVLSTNSYEFWIPDTTFAPLNTLPKTAVKTLLHGVPNAAGFHYWRHGAVVHRANPGLRGFLEGYRHACEGGIDLYETVQGEHLFRHLLDELARVPHAGWVVEEIWHIRSEILSPAQKARVLIRYLELLVERAQRRLGRTQREEN